MTPRQQLKEELRTDLHGKLNELFDSPQGKKALKRYMTKASMQAAGDPKQIRRNQKRKAGMTLVHQNYSGELNAAMNKKSKKQRLGKPVKRDTLKGIVRGAKVGAEGIGNVVGGAVEALRATAPGLRRVWGGTRHTATGASIIGKHIAREVRPQVRKRPLTSLVLAAALGAGGAYGAKKAYDWWNTPNTKQKGETYRRIVPSGRGPTTFEP
jgi:hypothetical protein